MEVSKYLWLLSVAQCADCWEVSFGKTIFLLSLSWFLWGFFLIVFMVFNATFNNISVISWRSVLLVEETGAPWENLPHVTDKLYHIMLYTSPWVGFKPTASVVIGMDCIGSCKSNYHTIQSHDGPWFLWSVSDLSILIASANFCVSHLENYIISI